MFTFKLITYSLLLFEKKVRMILHKPDRHFCAFKTRTTITEQTNQYERKLKQANNIGMRLHKTLFTINWYYTDNENS